jgi:hypothetical protein
MWLGDVRRHVVLGSALSFQQLFSDRRAGEVEKKPQRGGGSRGVARRAYRPDVCRTSALLSYFLRSAPVPDLEFHVRRALDSPAQFEMAYLVKGPVLDAAGSLSG